MKKSVMADRHAHWCREAAFALTNSKESISALGRKNKAYRKSLRQQAYYKLKGMQAFGESKKNSIKTDQAKDKIFSFSTFRTYWKHIKYFVAWMNKTHPEITTLKAAKPYVNEWLQSRVDQVDINGRSLSAWTIQTETAALGKLFSIDRDDPNRFVPPPRKRENIKRSRESAVRDKHFSKTNNAALISFCRGTGLRRAGIQSITGKDLVTRAQIDAEIHRITAIPSAERSSHDVTLLNICMDTKLFGPSQIYYVHTREKGGRERLAPIVGPDVDEIIQRFRETKPDEKVWGHVNSNADIHSYRADYALRVYRKYARPMDKIPYDRINKGSGRQFQGDVYTCRKDEYGKKLDKKAMLICSKALGHNRVEVVASNYLRGV